MKRFDGIISGWLIPFVAALALFPMLLALMLPYNQTRSMPIGFYLRVPAWGLEPGDVVQVKNPMVPGYMGVSAYDNLVKRIASISEDGLYELQGNTLTSFDSDYYGLVGRDFIVARLIPVITWEKGSDEPENTNFIATGVGK